MTTTTIESCKEIIEDEFKKSKKISTNIDGTIKVDDTILTELEVAIKERLTGDVLTGIFEVTNNDVTIQEKIKNNQKRMNELADYKYHKTLEYKNIMKRIVYSCIIIIGLTYVIKLPFFPSLIGKGLIIIIISYNIYHLIMTFIWNFRRDSKYWDKFNQITAESLDANGDITLSKWEHNKRSLEKMTKDASCSIN